MHRFLVICFSILSVSKVYANNTTAVVDVWPDRPFYDVNSIVDISVGELNDTRNSTSKLPFRVISPSQNVSYVDDLNGFKFEEEGKYTIVVDIPGQGQTLIKDLIVEDLGPEINVKLPKRGDIAGTNTTIIIAGSIEDDISGVASASLNGQPIDIQDDTFMVSLPLQHGINIFEITAKNRAGLSSTSTGSTYQSDAWITDHQDMVKDGFKLFVQPGDFDRATNQILRQSMPLINAKITQAASAQRYNFFDDNFTASVEFVKLNPIVLNSKLGTNEISVNGYFVVSDGSPALRTRLWISTKIPILENFYFFSPALPIAINIRKLGFSATLSISKNAGDKLHLEVKSLSLEHDPSQVDIFVEDNLISYSWRVIKYLSPDLFQRGLKKMLDAGLFFFSKNIYDSFRPGFEDEVKSTANEISKNFLHDVDLIREFDFNAPWISGEDKLFSLKIGLSTLSIKNNGVIATFDTRLKSPIETVHSKDLLLRGSCNSQETTPWEFNSDNSLQFAVSLDAINQVLHAIWSYGLLDSNWTLDETHQRVLESIDISDVIFDTQFLLPPLLDDCNEDNKLYYGVGEALIHSKFDFGDHKYDFKGYMTHLLELQLESVDDVLQTKIAEIKTWKVSVLQDGKTDRLATATIDSLLKTIILPRLTQAIVGHSLRLTSLSARKIPVTFSPDSPSFFLEITPKSVTHEKGMIVFSAEIMPSYASD